MVLERLEGIVVCTEALIGSVVVLVDGAPRPAMTLDAKVLLERRVSSLCPAPLSKMPCANVMEAGTFHRSICSMAMSLYWLIYC